MSCPHCSNKHEARLTDLTSRELDVLKHVVQGLTNKEIGVKLFITEKTVKYHMTAILKKKGVKSRHQLIYQAASDHGLLNRMALQR